MRRGVLQPTKNVIKPSKKMKHVYWNRFLVDPTTQSNVVWLDLLEPKVNTEEIEDLFCVKKVTVKEKKVDAKPKKHMVLDSKRSQAVAIMKSTLPRDFNVLKAAILIMDRETLSEDVVNSLLANMGTPEEVKEITKVREPSRVILATLRRQ